MTGDDGLVGDGLGGSLVGSMLDRGVAPVDVGGAAAQQQATVAGANHGGDDVQRLDSLARHARDAPRRLAR